MLLWRWQPRTNNYRWIIVGSGSGPRSLINFCACSRMVTMVQFKLRLVKMLRRGFLEKWLGSSVTFSRPSRTHWPRVRADHVEGLRDIYLEECEEAEAINSSHKTWFGMIMRRFDTRETVCDCWRKDHPGERSPGASAAAVVLVLSNAYTMFFHIFHILRPNRPNIHEHLS